MPQQELRSIVSMTRRRQWLLFHRPIEQRLVAIQELARRAAAEPEAASALDSVWSRVLREGNHALLRELARQVGHNRVVSAVAALMKSFSLRAIASDTGGVRDAVIDAVATIGPVAASAVTPAIADPDPTVAAWALMALRRLGVSKACEAIATCFNAAPAGAQQRMVQKLAGISKQSWEEVILLLDACLRGSRSEAVLAERVLQTVDRNQLERECVRLWTTCRSVPARSLLVRIFDYDAAALK